MEFIEDVKPPMSPSSGASTIGRQSLLRWINAESNKEARRELGVIGSMFKADPLSPLTSYMSSYAMNGMGLFVEGFVLFSIGNLEPLFASVWPQCWKTREVCSPLWVNAVTYLEIAGIIIGQLLVGIEGDWVGRRFGLIQGVGVGGEYPMTSTRALECGGSGCAGTRKDRLHRGRTVVLAFLMQGWGQVFNQVILILLLVIFHHGKTTPPFSEGVAQYTFRVSFGLVAILHLWLLYMRVYHMENADSKVKEAKKRSNTSGYDSQSLNLVFGHYWHRLLATSGAWFCSDFFFYGGKIFAGVFIGIIKPGASLFTTWEFNLINIAVSLVGYYTAALLIDHKSYGRKTMQQVGFGVDFVSRLLLAGSSRDDYSHLSRQILFLFGAIFFKQLQEPGVNIKVFATMYYISSFFNQFGPNCTTFLVAGEVYPASAKFWVVPWLGLMGALLTWAFLPDTTGLDLREQERYWACVRAGHPGDYHGIAVHRRHLSWYEIHILHRDRNYNAELDKEAKIDELRILYESSLIGDELHEDHSFLSPDVIHYFEHENLDKRVVRQSEKEQALHRDAPQVMLQSELEATMRL
ncbi:hypothetical protein RQP46_001065 [Phenoliferia psychrophenolica]